MNRRDFFKIVATTGAAAATAGCQQATESILPLVVPNELLIPGVASWFATVCRECPAGCGVLARNREGRVVKLEGNPDHPVNQGALCARGQAALQGLYHPDRFAGPQRREGDTLKPATWDDALKTLGDKLGGVKGKAPAPLAVITQLESGSLGALLDKWTQALGGRPRVTLEPFGYEAIRAANKATFGRDAIPYYAIQDAEVVLSFGADFLETWLSNVHHAQGFARMHTFREGKAGTFIHVEPRQSLTASNADEWVRNAPGTEAAVALAILKLMLEGGLVADKRFADAVAAVDPKKVAADSGVPLETLEHVAKTFAAARPGLAIGGGVAVSGSHATATQVAINLLNAAAGNVGKTVRFGPDSAYGKVTPYAEVARLVQAMAAGEIEVLVLGSGVNPAFTLPGGLKVAEAIRKVPFVVSFSNLPDETTALAHLVLPDTHWLESWGDYSPMEGVAGVLQPTMKPIKDARPMGDVLLAAGRATLGSEAGKGPLPWESFELYLKSAWEPVVKGQWAETLSQGGVWRETAVAAVTPKIDKVDAAAASLEGGEGLALIAYPSSRWYDGRAASRSWLQETPDTMTQTVWDSWAEINTETAGQLGIRAGDVVKLTSPNGSIEVPAYLSPTIHPGAVAVPIGHRYAPYHLRLKYVPAGSTGANPMALLPAAAEAASGGPVFLSVKVSVVRTGARRPLALLQATHDQDERELVRHVDLATARKEALAGTKPAEAHLSMYPEHEYKGYRWGMAVDVDACIGCQACVVACHAENNVPIVGKAEAAYGRQVSWLRIERWAEGPADHPHNGFLPMFCQHCEIAPCEPVCPVFAAYHTEEGLNGQVYNRCVGTRYCGNNCPYHVRRFNWWSYEFPSPLEIQLNPDVTVRQLGIMEKCTMCIQRIVAGKDHAHRDEKRAVRDGDIQTACQQTCPTKAITFGNLKDEGSAVSKLAHAARAYNVLDEVGTRPNVHYLKKVVRAAHGPEGPKPAKGGHA
ncbi:MAG TPA: molybdopterin-dependent oxidoreductase [Candidatus Binatia bacterium]|nr:molybdopterin-dependent oxidoreductase [Candidatus Binatia bacterium]